MTTAAIIAVYTKGRRADEVRQWRGVFHAEDGAPWQLGNELLFRARRARGDLDAVAREAVADAPYGWASLAHRRPAEKQEQARFYSPKILRAHGGPAPRWIYLVDPEARRLDAYLVDLGQPTGHAPEPVASASFDERGRSTPHQFVAPPPPWQAAALVEGWEDERGEGIRQRFTEQVAAWCAQVEISPDALAERLYATISSALARSLPGDPLYTRFAMDEGSRVWALRLADGRTLRYPTRAARRIARGLGQSPGDVLRLANDEREEAELSLGAAELAEALAEAPWPEDWPPPRRVLGQLLLAVANAKLPGALYSVEGLKLVRARRVVEEVNKPLNEVALADARRRDKRVRLDDLERRATSVDFIWTALDWLRARQIGG